MASLTPSEGLAFTADKVRNASEWEGWRVYQVAVGSGGATLDSTDTQLDVEEFRANTSDENVSISRGGVGGITALISVEGGVHVPAGTTVTEFALFAVDPDDAPNGDDSKDVLLDRHLRDGVTIDSGDRKTFEIPFDVVSK